MHTYEDHKNTNHPPQRINANQSRTNGTNSQQHNTQTCGGTQKTNTKTATIILLSLLTLTFLPFACAQTDEWEYGYGWYTTAPSPIPTAEPWVLTILVLIPAIAIAFSILAFLKPNDQDPANMRGMITAALAAVIWFIYGGIWTYNFTVIPYLYISYLWLAIGFVYALLALIYVILYVSAGYKMKQNQGLRLQQTEDF